MPLYPTLASARTEVPIRGMLAMALNGVPAYGPQESDSLNAVEGMAGVKGANFWYGHSGGDQVWHVHNPQMGEETVTSDTHLGYAMDGFPIYGPVSDNDVNKLDGCNGMVNDSGNYQYHVKTLDQVDGDLEYCSGDSPETNWNYVLGCYSGSIASSDAFDSTTYTLDSDCFVDPDPAYDNGNSNPTTPTDSSPSNSPNNRPTRLGGNGGSPPNYAPTRYETDDDDSAGTMAGFVLYSLTTTIVTAAYQSFLN